MLKIYYIIPLLILTACQTISESASFHKAPAKMVKASWYGVGDGSSSHTSSGARFRPYGLTAAHRHLPFGTKLHITNPKNNRTVIVVVNDRGPNIRGVEIDLTKGAANAIGMTGNQTVKMERIVK